MSGVVTAVPQARRQQAAKLRRGHQLPGYSIADRSDSSHVLVRGLNRLRAGVALTSASSAWLRSGHSGSRVPEHMATVQPSVQPSAVRDVPETAVSPGT